MALTVGARQIGKKDPLFPDWSIDWPGDQPAKGDALTLRDLITRVVHEEVEAFKRRQSDRRLVRVLSAPMIAEGLERGKADSGGRTRSRA